MAKKNIQIVYTVNDAALLKAQKTIEANESAAKKADDQVKKFGKSASTAGNEASKSFLNLGTVWRSLIAIGIISFVTNLGKKILDLGIKQEQLNIAFTTFLGSAEKAKKLLADLNKFALVTPFTPDQVNNAAKALLAFGVRGEEIIPTLKMLGDVSSGTGKDLTEMAIIFGQIRSTGRLMGQDLLQLINAGFNPLQVISEKTGKSMKLLKQEMEKGLISFDMVSDAFKSATAEGGLFFNLMEKQSQSVGGVLSTIEGNVDEILKNIFTATSGPVKAFVEQLLELSDAFLELSKSDEQKFLERQNEQIRLATDGFMAYAKAFHDINDARTANEAEIDTEIANLIKRNDAIYAGAKAAEGEYTANLKRIDSLNLERQAIKLYFDELARLKKLEDDKLASDKATRDAAAAEIAKGGRALYNATKAREKADEEEKTANEKKLSGLRDYGARVNTEVKGQVVTELKIRKEKSDAEIKLEEETANRRMQLQQMAFNYGVALLGQFLTAKLDASDEEFKRERVDFTERLKLAGNNERARQEIEADREEFEAAQDARAQEFALQKAKKDKERQIKQMIIQGLLNTIHALGNPPVPNFAAAAITGGFTLAQLAIAKGVGFKEGGINIQGPGTTTSDSIPARISRGESVINAQATARSLNLLTAINERRIDDKILYKSRSDGQTSVMDTSGIEGKLDALIEKSPDYYEEGHFVNKRVRKSDALIVHLRGKYFSS